VSVPITAATEIECERLAYLKKSEFLAGKTHVQKLPKDMTLQDAMNTFLRKREKTLSPSTLRSYTSYSKNLFPDYRKKKLSQIKWQEMIDDELATASEKTVKNAWSFVSASLKAVGYPVPHVNLAKPVVPDLNFLQPEEITKFCQTLEGRSYEIPALLALHGLRMSELRGLDWKNVDLENGLIFVQGARVRGVSGDVDRKQNKNRDSSRYVPVMIPRLTDVLTAVTDKTGKVCRIGSNTLLDDVKRCCRIAGVTICTVHDLRRSFASLCFYLQIPSRQIQEWGGWKDDVVLNKIYIKLSNTMKTESKDKFTQFFTEEK
jgi:integrase